MKSLSDAKHAPDSVQRCEAVYQESVQFLSKFTTGESLGGQATGWAMMSASNIHRGVPGRGQVSSIHFSGVYDQLP